MTLSTGGFVFVRLFGLLDFWCHRPFKVIEKSSKPSVQVNYRGEDRNFVSFHCPHVTLTVSHSLFSFPDARGISAMILGKMKETAEAYLGKKVTHAVVTVPACAVSIRIICGISLLTPLQTSTTLNARQHANKRCWNYRWPADPPYHQ